MLSQDQIADFQSQGLTVYPDFLKRHQLAELLEEMDRLGQGQTLANHDRTRMEMEPHQPPKGTAIRRIYSPCSHYQPFRVLSRSDPLLNCVEQLLGPNLLLHYSKINMKPASVGSVVEWHQDLAYYPLTNPDSLAILFYLDDTDRNNGGLRIIPDCHRKPLLDHTREGYFQGRVTESVDDSKAVLIEGGAGTAIFMHCLAPHASAPNLSARSRRTLILSYRAADAFPIYCGTQTTLTETDVPLVRGQAAASARFTWTDFPIPCYPRKVSSLYDLQEISRRSETQQ